MRLDINWLDYAILGCYFLVVLGIGWLAQAQHQDQPRLLAVRPRAARVGHRPRVRRGEPRRPRDPGHGRQRRAVRDRHGALLLGRRRPGDGLPRHRDDAVLLRLEGPQRPGVPAGALQQPDPPAAVGLLRGGGGAHRRRQPLRARPGDRGAARLAAGGGHPRLRRAGARLHHPRRPVLRDLQRGAAVLRHPGRPDPARRRGPARQRRLGRLDRQGGCEQERRRRVSARLAGHRCR